MEQGIRILIGTEDQLLSDLVGDIVRGMPGEFVYHHCLTPTGSILLASQYMPDAVLIDERLPDFATVINEVRMEDPRTVIALITGNEGRSALGAALEVGARDYLSRKNLNRRSVERCLWSVMAAKAGLLSSPVNPSPVEVRHPTGAAVSGDALG